MIDVVTGERPDSMRLWSIRRRRADWEAGADLQRSRLVRIRIPVGSADPSLGVSVEELCPPERHSALLWDTAVNPRRVGLPYRYVFGSCILGPRPCNSLNAVCRVDVTTGEVLTWHDSPNAVMSGPPKFVPRPGADANDEADGVLLVDCLGADGRAFFAVLDGRTFAEVSRITLPYRHCVSLSNTWVWG